MKNDFAENNGKMKSEHNVLIYKSEELFGKKNEIIIEHQGSLYRLRITRNGKLIMNK